MSASGAFRGIKGIREVRARVEPLAAWYRKYKPEVAELILERADYDLIARWPRAADFEGFVISDSGIYFQGFLLTYDTGESRYIKSPAPEQKVIA